MNKYKKPLLLGSLLALAISCQTQAAVSADQADKLGTSLTPIGAEMAGNADGKKKIAAKVQGWCRLLRNNEICRL